MRAVRAGRRNSGETPVAPARWRGNVRARKRCVIVTIDPVTLRPLDAERR
jgi:hypothetical protein